MNQVVHIGALLSLECLNPIEQLAWLIHPKILILIYLFSNCRFEHPEHTLYDHLLVLEYVVVRLIRSDPLEELLHEHVLYLEHGLECLVEVSSIGHLIP